MVVVPRITCVAGLPGSGKSTWLAAQSRLIGAKVFDDFRADAFNDDPAFAASRHITALKEVIAEGARALPPTSTSVDPLPEPRPSPF